MRKLAFIPTREAKERPIKTFLEKAGWVVHYLVNESSIFEAYTKAFKDNNIIAKDKVILCHDDIQILNTPEMFNEVVDKNLTKDVGFLGIAGPQRLNKTSCWWHGLGKEYPHPDSFLRGCVWHGDSLDECFPTYYGGYGEVEVLDGLLLITTGSTLNNIKTCQLCDRRGYRYKVCFTCEGARQIEQDCSYCKARGVVGCSRCSGSGMITRVNIFNIVEYFECERCDGRGRLTCPVCEGNLKEVSSCRTCGGSGRLTSENLCDHNEEPHTH